MASFQADITIEGHRYSLLRCEYRLYQEVSSSGKPTSGVRSSTIKILIYGDKDDALLSNWAAEPAKKLGGLINFYSVNSEQVFKFVKFSDAYCVRYVEIFSPNGLNVLDHNRFIPRDWDQGFKGVFKAPRGNQPAYLFEVAISAAVIQIGGVAHKNPWPDVK
jgi:hypothetical protein